MMKKNGTVIHSYKIKFVEGCKIKKYLLFGPINDIVARIKGVIFAFVIAVHFSIKSMNRAFFKFRIFLKFITFFKIAQKYQLTPLFIHTHLF